MHHIVTLILAAVMCAAGVRAQCDPNTCDNIYPVQYPWVQGGDCGVDPGDGTYPEYGFELCPCMSATFIQTAIFTSNGVATTAAITSTLQPATTTTVYFPFSALPNTAIDQGALVTGTVQYINPTGTYYPEALSYTNLAVSSIFYATATSTITTYTTSTTCE